MPWNPPGRREPVPCPPPKRQVPAVPRGPQSFPTSPWGKGPLCPARLGPSSRVLAMSLFRAPFSLPKMSRWGQ